MSAIPETDQLRSVFPQVRDAFRDPSSRFSGTYMFVDQCGSTEMKTSQPESSWLSQLGFLYDTVAEIVRTSCPEAHLKFLGDGILVTVDSDHATKVVNAAIQIQEAVSEASKPNDQAMGEISFQVSIGVTTGDSKRVRDPQGTVDHVGLVVDKARRLCDIASPRAIFIDLATQSAANMVRVQSRLGQILHRGPDEYAGDRQLAPALKGIPAQVEYHEVKWEQQLFGLKSASVTNSTARVAPISLAPPAATSPAVSVRTDQRSGQRCVGKVKSVNPDRGFAFLADNSSGEEFYLAKSAMAYPEDFEKLARDKEVAFIAAAPSAGKCRRATVALVVGEFADGTLTALSHDKPYGFITVEDNAGGRHMVYMAVDTRTKEFVKGAELSFRVASTTQGARAEEVTPTEESDVA